MKKTIQRVDKILSNLGYCSRRTAAGFLDTHQVTTMSGNRVGIVSMKMQPDELLVDALPLDCVNGLFLIMNKPAGYVCSHERLEGKRIYDLLPERWMQRHPIPATIGRLDKDTTGAILITDHTALIHAFSSPRTSIEKVYDVHVATPLSEDIIPLFAQGTMLLEGEEKPCLPAVVTIKTPFIAELTITEGRYHQVKRMFQKYGYTVTALHRSRYGSYTLDGIDEGMYVHIPLPELSPKKRT